MAEPRCVKELLGMDSCNITRCLPIRKRNFDIWVVLSESGKIIGFLSYKDGQENSKFIKEFYINPLYRRQGYGKKLLELFHKSFLKLECKINQGNNIMYKLVKSINMRGEKSVVDSLFKDKNRKPIWWSNYKDDSNYIK